MKNSAFCDVAFLKSSQLNGFALLFSIERQILGIKMKNAGAKSAGIIVLLIRYADLFLSCVCRHYHCIISQMKFDEQEV